MEEPQCQQVWVAGRLQQVNQSIYRVKVSEKVAREALRRSMKAMKGLELAPCLLILLYAPYSKGYGHGYDGQLALSYWLVIPWKGNWLLRSRYCYDEDDGDPELVGTFNFRARRLGEWGSGLVHIFI